jgi:hypothetical protein
MGMKDTFINFCGEPLAVAGEDVDSGVWSQSPTFAWATALEICDGASGYRPGRFRGDLPQAWRTRIWPFCDYQMEMN